MNRVSNTDYNRVQGADAPIEASNFPTASTGGICGPKPCMPFPSARASKPFYTDSLPPRYVRTKTNGLSVTKLDLIDLSTPFVVVFLALFRPNVSKQFRF